MTKARDISSLIGSSGQIDNGKITLDVNEIPNLTTDKIPNLDAGKITTGTFADARLSQSSVQQHATSFDDNKIVNDISTLALRQASDANRGAYNTNSQSVDVFQDDTGIDTTTNALRNASEYVSTIAEIITAVNAFETGDRRSEYTVTTSLSQIASVALSDVSSGLDGDTSSSNTNNSWYFEPNGGGAGGEFIQWELNNGVTKQFTGMKIYQNTANNNGTWKIQGSNDGSSWTDLFGNFTWGSSATSTHTWSNSTYYKYIRTLGIAGSTIGNSAWQYEQQFQVANKKSLTANATGNFTGTTITAPSSVSEMGAIITYQDASGTNALNTDIVLQLSADGGSNYSTATLTALPDFSTGIKMAKVNDLAVTAGTQLKYKINFANQASGSKEARIRGVALQY